MRGALKRKKSKCFVQLTETINAIPKGVYYLQDSNRDGVNLRIGHKIHVSLTGTNVYDYLVHLTAREGKKRRMRANEFLDKYYELLNGLRFAKPDYSKPVTLCALDPSLARELH